MPRKSTTIKPNDPVIHALTDADCEDFAEALGMFGPVFGVGAIRRLFSLAAERGFVITRIRTDKKDQGQ